MLLLLLRIMGYTARWRRPALQLCIAATRTNSLKYQQCSSNTFLFKAFFFNVINLIYVYEKLHTNLYIFII